MSYLLDTHTFLWFVDDDPMLPCQLRELIGRSRDVSIHVSVVSFWEMAIKSGKGKLDLPCPIDRMMVLCEDELKISILRIEGVHLEALRTLPQLHKDPFDRLLIAQAMTEAMTLISADDRVSLYPVQSIWT